MNTTAIRSVPKGRFVAIAIVLALLMAAAYGFAAANTVGASKAGSGSQTISGYDVSAVSYDLDGEANNITAVNFTLDGAAKTVKAKLVSGSTTYFPCTNSGDMNWTCAVTGVSATQANQLAVNAAQ